LLGFEKVGIELGGLVFRSRVAAVNGIEVSTGHGAYFDVRALGFRHRVPEIAHFRIYVGHRIPTGSKLIQIERQARFIRGEQQEGDIEPRAIPTANAALWFWRSASGADVSCQIATTPND